MNPLCTLFFYTFRNGILRAGKEILPLPLLPESPRLPQRVAFAVLLHFFGGEHQAERKAYVLHKQVARYIQPVVAPCFFLSLEDAVAERNPLPFVWSLSANDLHDIVAQALVDWQRSLQTEPVEIEYCGGQRRDLLRSLATPMRN